MNYKILIADDDTELVKMLHTFFELRNYTVITASDGAETLKMIERKPDIILLDINMPKADGIEVCQRIRDKVSCPILFLTARADEQDRVNGLMSGGDDYILKPFSLKELEARIIAHLKREERRQKKSTYRFQGDLSIDYSAKTVQINGQDALRQPVRLPQLAEQIDKQQIGQIGDYQFFHFRLHRDSPLSLNFSLARSALRAAAFSLLAAMSLRIEGRSSRCNFLAVNSLNACSMLSASLALKITM